MVNRFTALLERAKATSEPIMVDGGTGTMLMSMGLLFGDPPETWNVLPAKIDHVRSVYRGYLDAGAQIILTNTFGGSPFRLKMHNLQDRTFELNKAGAALARVEAGTDEHAAVVAGDIGPSGEIFEPMGSLKYDEAVEGFRRQAEGLVAGGVDCFWIETMSDLKEVRAAIEGARQVAPDMPVVATLTFDTRGFTMMGVSPADAINALADLNVAAIGGNCGNGPDELEAVIYAMSLVRTDIPLVAKSNAGMPVMVDGKATYNATPAIMADCARRMRAFGATIIGACCGSTPAHIAAMKDALYNQPPLDPSTLSLTVPLAKRQEAGDRRERRARREAAGT